MNKKQIYEQMKKIVETSGGKILLFEYHKKIFVNIIITIQKGLCVYEFVTDRGEIFCNKKPICNDSYYREENKKTHEKLLEVIKGILETSNC